MSPTIAKMAICLCSFFLIVHGQITLKADDNSGHDSPWVKRYANGKNTWGINGTGSPLSGSIWFDNFPGSDGNYKVEIGAVTEPDGNSPYKIFAGADGNTLLREGNYPYSTGEKRCDEGTLKSQYLDAGIHSVKKGDKIRFWVQSVYPCGSSHGQYGRFWELRFTPTSEEPDPDPEPDPIGKGVKTFYEKNGLLAFEVENTEITDGNWKLETSYTGYLGKGYMRWNGGDHMGGRPNCCALIYKFVIAKPGTYHLRIRAQSGTADQSLENDHWVHVNDDNDRWYKFFSFRAYNHWNWQSGAEHHDLSYNAPVKYSNLKAGTYTMTIKPRSYNHAMDRIAFIHNDYADEYKVANNEHGDETKLESIPLSPTSPDGGTPIRLQRATPARSGNAIVTQLFMLDGRKIAGVNPSTAGINNAIKAHGVILAQCSDGSIQRMVSVVNKAEIPVR